MINIIFYNTLKIKICMISHSPCIAKGNAVLQKHKWTVLTIMNHLTVEQYYCWNLIWTRHKLGDIQPGHIEALWFSSVLLMFLLSYNQPLNIKTKYTQWTVYCYMQNLQWDDIEENQFYHILKDLAHYFSISEVWKK